MIIGDKFIFIHNPGHGGRTVKSVLKSLFPNAIVMKLNSRHFHKPVRALFKDDYYGKMIDKDINPKGKLLIGTIRNPWDWYTCIYRKQVKGNELYRRYSDGKLNDFKTFMTNLLSKEYNKKIADIDFCLAPGDITETTFPRAKFMSLNDFGFFTMRFVYMFFVDCLEILNRDIILTSENFDNLLTMDKVLNLDNLIEDFLSIYDAIGAPEGRHSSLEGLRVRVGRYGHPRKEHYSQYYDNNIRDLVYEKDKILIEKFNYKFEDHR